MKNGRVFKGSSLAHGAPAFAMIVSVEEDPTHESFCKLRNNGILRISLCYALAFDISSNRSTEKPRVYARALFFCFAHSVLCFYFAISNSVLQHNM